MPAIATPKPDADSFLIMATEVHKLLTKSAGTDHARVRQLAKVLRDLANTNYDRGWNDAQEAQEGAPVETNPDVGKLVRSKHQPGCMGILIRDTDGQLVMQCEPDKGNGMVVEEGEYELAPSGDAIPCVGSRVIISGATPELEGRTARIGAMRGDMATVQMEDDISIAGVNKALLKVIH